MTGHSSEWLWPLGGLGAFAAPGQSARTCGAAAPSWSGGVLSVCFHAGAVAQGGDPERNLPTADVCFPPGVSQERVLRGHLWSTPSVSVRGLRKWSGLASLHAPAQFSRRRLWKGLSLPHWVTPAGQPGAESEGEERFQMRGMKPAALMPSPRFLLHLK